MAQIPPCSANESCKAILLCKTTLARKSSIFCCVAMAIAGGSMIAARIKDHCLPVREQREKASREKAKGIKISFWRYRS